MNMGKVDLKVDWATHEAAKYACENWHYSKSIPIGKLVKIGAWENNKFIGVVIFGRGTAKSLGSKYGLKQDQCVELVRISLTKHVSPVTKIMKFAQRYLKLSNKNIRLIVSFASQDAGHHGGIYQGANWIYSGLTAYKGEFLYKGKRATDRQVSALVSKTKISRGELEKRGFLTKLPTNPKYRYLMPLDADMRKQIAPLAKPYPKRVKQAMADVQLAQRQGSTDRHAPNYNNVNIPA